MKSLRRSLHKDSHPPTISTPISLPPVSKPSASTLPPKSVIRANDSYRPMGPQELGFSKGDFFYVIREVEAGGKAYFEAHNPVTGARGLVPRRCFDEINKVSPNTRTSHPVGPAARFASSNKPGPPPNQSARTRTFYAIVQHDFIAERTDELDARAGDPISVVAQSNKEWFVAKPIGRLGGPGLIPVSFVEIRDPVSGEAIRDVEGLMSRGELPKVEDWKKKTMDYKASSIPLGVIDDAPPVPNSPYQPTSFPISNQAGSGMQDRYKTSSSPPIFPPEDDSYLPPGMLMSGEVSSFHFENDYWFSINALYQPDSGPAQQLMLYRVYDDFYDFQISLLDAFPNEAGRAPDGSSERILPYMPGPVPSVDDIITAQRRVELDEYLKDLCNLRNHGAAYILRHDLVRAFVSPRPGDVQKEVKGNNLAAGRQGNRTPSPAHNSIPDSSQFGRPSGDRSPPHPYATAQSHRRKDSSSSINYDTPSSAFSSGLHSSGNTTSSSFRSPSPGYSNSPLPSGGKGQNTNSYTGSSGSRHSEPSSSANLTNPPISASNPSPAFLKIKIFDRQTDELVAIRLPPRVTYYQLMEKTRERLGDEIRSLSFRTSSDSGLGALGSANGGFVEIVDDADLRDWIETADKLVLYAD